MCPFVGFVQHIFSFCQSRQQLSSLSTECNQVVDYFVLGLFDFALVGVLLICILSLITTFIYYASFQLCIATDICIIIIHAEHFLEPFKCSQPSYWLYISMLEGGDPRAVAVVIVW